MSILKCSLKTLFSTRRKKKEKEKRPLVTRGNINDCDEYTYAFFGGGGSVKLPWASALSSRTPRQCSRNALFPSFSVQCVLLALFPTELLHE